jgi:hypothetical protein
VLTRLNSRTVLPLRGSEIQWSSPVRGEKRPASAFLFRSPKISRAALVKIRPPTGLVELPASERSQRRLGVDIVEKVGVAAGLKS